MFLIHDIQFWTLELSVVLLVLTQYSSLEMEKLWSHCALSAATLKELRLPVNILCLLFAIICVNKMVTISNYFQLTEIWKQQR